jgi:cold-inducible RNA-binding protein
MDDSHLINLPVETALGFGSGSVLHSKCLLRVPPELGCPDLPCLARTIERQKELIVKNIFVGNLDFAATDSSVRAMFERYGTVDRVNLVTDRDTGRSRGFAFVEMSNTEEADRAIAGLNGAAFEGRALNVNEARPKGQGGGGGGRASGNGYARQRREPRW